MNTKEALADCGRTLLLRKGVNGFSFQDLSDALKIKKASVHHHFRTKGDLLLNVIQGVRAKFDGWVRERSSDSRPQDNLRAYLRIFENFCQQGQANCPVGSLSADFESLPANLRAEARELLKAHMKFVESQIDGMKDPLRTSKKDIALLMVCSALGAVQVGRIMNDKNTAKKAGSAFLELLEGT